MSLYWDWLFDKSIRKFMGLSDFTQADEDLLRDLITGWGNQGYSSMTGYAREYIRRGASNRGDVLDCGSGLSTIVLGIMGDRFGYSVVSLEENPDWAKKVMTILTSLGIKSVIMDVRKGKHYEGYYWYDPSIEIKNRTYDLVLLDGPSNHDINARYGLFPVMINHLAPGCTILADDFNDLVYRASLLKAESDFNLHITPVEGADPFAVITVEA